MDFQVRAESGKQLLARLSTRPSLKGLDERLLGVDGPLPHDVIEITGDVSVGKSVLALQWVTRAILSPPRGGLGVEVLLIDADHHQSLFTLVQLLQARMKAFTAQTSGLRLTSSLVETSIKDALKRLTIINVYDSTNLYTAILALDKMLLSKPQISMVVVDSLTAFYWSDRLAGGLQHMDSYLRRLLSALQKSTKEHKVMVVFTRPSYFQSAARSRFKMKEDNGESTRLVSLNRLEKDISGGSSKDGDNQSATNKDMIENIFSATIRSAYGQKILKYHITKEGMQWL
ncbi:DNA repair protein XRCC2 isoform X2 [Frankliniella occidentalis]|nr:DNA repair protein XRCC2 isoform X2 [Frankliniella occidentalis]XP_026291072.1 DNA repair protein XRCC2 isoform X2 [Frankliniella occidentalis]